MSNLNPFTFSTPIQGVQVKPLQRDGKQIQIRYNGILQKQNAQQVWLHAGYGDSKSWVDVKEHLMEQGQTGWEQTITLKDKQLNFCFRDQMGKWDNNNGDNWTYKIL